MNIIVYGVAVPFLVSYQDNFLVAGGILLAIGGIGANFYVILKSIEKFFGRKI